MKKIKIAAILLFISNQICAQGFNHVWKLGYGSFFDKGIMLFDSSSSQFSIENRKMGFEGTEATISDKGGNFLMSSNGVWIANANNDTMLNGAGLNPGYFVGAFPKGLVITNGNIFLPYPGDTTKYILIHQTENDMNYGSTQLYYSIIDMSLDGGLGGVISKNDTLINDTIIWGIAACRHANGRDWWITTIKDNTDTAIVILFTPKGFSSITKQSLGFGYATPGNVSQLQFSPNGDKFVYGYPVYFLNKFNIVLSDFDRCTGLFSNNQVVQISNNDFVWGLSFSSSGQFVYACTSNEIIQVKTQNYIADTVAVYDGFCFPNNPWCTTFYNMYLAANGKIYITSGSSVQHIHEMNFPDSLGIACGVQQHNIFLNIWNFRAVPNHPNYYLGRMVGSPCDTVWQGMAEEQHDFRFRVYPNPVTNNSLHIGYLLPQSRGTSGSGTFQIYDVTGKVVFKYTLPQWSNEQSFTLPDLSNGVYNCVITSNNFRVSKKLVVIKE